MYQLKKLQLILNRGARLIVGLSVTPVLTDFHWSVKSLIV